jgi:hypothetical protein
MRFLHKKFQAKKKEIIEVTLDRPARVKFMTANEYRKYERARTHTFYGGRFDDRVIHFVLPFDSVWVVVVEGGPLREPISVKASCRLLPPDREVRTSPALDAPASVTQALLEGEAEAISAGSQSEG